MNWDEYKPFDPGVWGPLHELPRREARAAFQLLMAAKSERIDELRRLLENNGVELSSSSPGLQALNDWFRSEGEGDPTVSRLRPIWYAVVNDIGLFLGDVMIERNPHLKWVMFDKGKRDLAYQRHVIMGFTRVPNLKYNIDPDLLTAMYGHRIIAGQGVETDASVSWVDGATAKA